MTSPITTVQHLPDEMLQVTQAGRSLREDGGLLHQGESRPTATHSGALPVGSLDIRYRKSGRQIRYNRPAPQADFSLTAIATQLKESESDEDAIVEDEEFVVGVMLVQGGEFPNDVTGSEPEDSDPENAAESSNPHALAAQDHPNIPEPCAGPMALLIDKEALKRAAKQAKSREKKRKRRERRKETGDEVKRVQLAHLTAAETVLTAELDVAAADHSSSGYIGLRHHKLVLRVTAGPRVLNSRGSLPMAMKFLPSLERSEVIDHPLIDKDSRVYTVVLVALNPQPTVVELSAYATGFSFGGGQTAPTPIARTEAEKAALSEFLTDQDVIGYFKFIEGKCCRSNLATSRPKD
ncbi:hypothetical protein FS837_000870 [Tulasnella sp. UAMH 9824]|nr:hypothetical protein FS837_000870 [Tulasnella sp. UAMH 9824]